MTDAGAMTWTVHPAARRPAAAVATIAIIALSGAAAAVIGRGLGWGLAATLFLLLSVSSFLWPTRYRLDDHGVEVRHLGGVRRRAWSELRRVEPVPGGVLLSPYRQRSLRDRVRGVLLRVDGDPSAVLARAEAQLRRGA